jgi:threonine/homoserine/homoserine lactone efflux protein
LLTLSQFISFLLAAALITISPGPDNLMVLGLGLSKGRQKGIAFGLGCAFGCLSHTVLAVAGVSALIAASPVAFTALKVCGGLYLIWLGIQAFRSAGTLGIKGPVADEQSPMRLFFKGVLANAINPKVALFFLSFLPQFVIPSHGHVGLQMAALGLTFTIQGAVIFGLLGYFSGAVGRWLNSKPKAGVILDRVAGTVFIGLGVRLITAR